MDDAFSRGRYATDASIYQIMPRAVVVPETSEDVRNVIRLAREEGVSVLPRGGGTSQCGQTVNDAIVIDTSKHLNRLVELDVEARTCVVEPGIVLDELNRRLKPHGLWYPIDVSTASRATIGGMAGNNSCGGRSLRYGMMRDNVLAIDAVLADGSEARFAEAGSAGEPGFVAELLALGVREQAEIAKKFPKVMRRVGGYNIDALVPNGSPVNLSSLLVGSEGTLAWSDRITLRLSPLPVRKAMGVCHFPTFHAAMDAAQHIVKLDPVAVELVDRTMIELARGIDIFRPTIEKVVKDEPDALLLVDFAEDDWDENLHRLKQLHQVMGDLGFDWSHTGEHVGGVVEVNEPGLQSDLAEVRKSGLNIMMSMKQEGKPVSFVEDCAVQLKDLAAYTAGLTDIFARHGTKGTWYAHASVGCLHVRPVLNMRLEHDVKTMRAIAEEAFELVRKYKGSHSGEHGDGIVRSEFNGKMFGPRMMASFRDVKQAFDPDGVFNPGKIVDAPKMDDRSLFRFNQDYAVPEMPTALDWSQWPGAGGGFQGAIEMCNNNGACRKLAGGAMCPSYRVTRDEAHLTRGRANSLRLAVSGQLGAEALAGDAMADTMKLCVGCKACRRECPTGVDMARMKIEVAAARVAQAGLSLRDRLVAHMPRYAPYLARMPWLANARDAVPGLARLSETIAGLSGKRALPKWRADSYRHGDAAGPADGTPVILFGDTFNTYFDSENLRAARKVLAVGGFHVVSPLPEGSSRPPCCGRTYLASGLVDEARAEARRLVAAYLPLVRAGARIVGLEPSCLLTLRDELTAMKLGEEAEEIAAAAMMFEEFVVAHADRFEFTPLERNVLLHGHCHQKAHNVMSSVTGALQLVPGLKVETVESSCCGMAGAFGYQAETYDVSRAMGELSLLPSVRAAESDTLIVADGTSCRHQIADGAQREAVHVARVLEMAIADNREGTGA
ncbi:FAD-linked oxidase C-terminal domain-containing protein [Anderseniella sp. Alg231-50]|uniref:FAD-linked oxidase C-terminal domain-containing protein n=1 Tax=Anderseniella sp. Alg231-50 TaxID=1922226 RepID=UPI000D54FEC7